MKKNLFITSVSIFIVLFAEATNRIQSFRVDRGETQTLYLRPGLGTIMFFPCPLIEVFLGRSEEVKAQISPNDRKALFVNLKKNSSVPTNLIARCEELRTVFVFDIIPSSDTHQDVVEIKSFFGRPSSSQLELKEFVEFEDSKTSVVIKKPEVMKKGK